MIQGGLMVGFCLIWQPPFNWRPSSWELSKRCQKRDQGIAKYQMLNTKIERTNMNPIVPRGIARSKGKGQSVEQLLQFNTL